MKNILNTIYDYKKSELINQKEKVNIDFYKKNLNKRNIKDFTKPFRENKFSIIGEVKKASPSKGLIRKDFNPVEIAEIYTKNGISCISILTDEKFFQGKLEYLQQIRKITDLPLLRKDFIFDEYQLYESVYYGADAILLIVKMLDKDLFFDLYKKAYSLGLDVLVETHSEQEIRIALEIDAQIIGINNRNLETFQTSIKQTEDLIKFIPNDKIIISESGISLRADIEKLISIGVNGALIGEAFTKETDIEQKIKELV